MKKWVSEKRLDIHKTNSGELRNLFNLVERDLRDAEITQLSPDRRFATAYNAALQLTTIAIRAAGYLVKGGSGGHHWITISSLPEIMGKNQKKRSDYFNACRTKRNITDYDSAGEISEEEVMDLIQEVKKFRKEVITWIKQKHPTLLV